MREFVIKSLDVLVWVVTGLIAIGGAIGGMVAIGQGEPGGILIIFIALLYAVIFAGSFFLFKGIYENTKRTAEALEKLLAK